MHHPRTCCQYLLSSHAVVTETFSKRVVVNLQLRNLQTTTETNFPLLRIYFYIGIQYLIPARTISLPLHPRLLRSWSDDRTPSLSPRQPQSCWGHSYSAFFPCLSAIYPSSIFTCALKTRALLLTPIVNN